ncbi:MAG: nuclear transport factor 2 family protein [Bryobacteraceae bacterium]
MTSKELVQSLYAAFGRGDVAFILERVAPDCTWVAPGTGIPNAGVYSGPAGVGAFFQKLASTENVTAFEPKEYFENGDSVVALGTEECTAIATGKQMKTDWAMLFRVSGGKVVYWQSFYDTSAYMVAHAK